MPDMVPVIVGNDHGIDLADVTAVRGKPVLRLHAGDPGVEQEPGAGRLT
jgi:hypothetical protein